MRKRKIFWLVTFVLGILFLSFMLIKKNNHNSILGPWVGKYTFYEFASPNQNMEYLITIYEDDGLYAYIKIDGFHTLKRLKTKVWSNGNEVMFEFYQYYTDEEGNSTINESCSEGDILFKLKKENGALITEWGSIRPMLTENEDPGQYFENE